MLVEFDGPPQMASRAYSADQLIPMAQFTAGLNFASAALLETYKHLPKQTRYVADIQRWIICHASYALYFENKLDKSKPEFTATAVHKLLEPFQVASRNTINAFMRELVYYDFVDETHSKDKRNRAFKATPEVEDLIRHYFAIHCSALDLMDGGARSALAIENRDFIYRAQPLFLRTILGQPEWYRPPPSIASFVRTDAGSNILHEFVARVGQNNTSALPARVFIGDVSATRLAEQFLISPSHVIRLFAKARSEGLMGWWPDSKRNASWISLQLVQDYRQWQALKFAALSQAIAATS